MYTWDAKVRAIYRDTDQMGVVYYGNYYTWFEVGRNEFIRSLGLSYKDLEEQGVMLPVIESRCTYKSPARYDDLVIVRTGICEMTGARIAFAYDVIREKDSALLARGCTVHAFADAKTMRPINLKKRCGQYYAKLADRMKNGG